MNWDDVKTAGAYAFVYGTPILILLGVVGMCLCFGVAWVIRFVTLFSF